MSPLPFGGQDDSWESPGPQKGANGPFASQTPPQRSSSPRGPIPSWLIAVGAVFAVAIIGALLVLGRPSEPVDTVGPDPSPTATALAVVPSVVGLEESAALARLTQSGFAVGNITTRPSNNREPGTVLSQSPSPGARVDVTQPINLVIAIIDKVQVPKIIGGNESSAVQALLNAGLVLGEVEEIASERALGTVLKQSIASGTLVAPGTAVNLTISNGKSVIPQVTGRSVQDAEIIMENAGFRTEVIRTGIAAKDEVQTTEPTAGTFALRGSIVTIYAPETIQPEPTVSPTPTPTEDPFCNSYYFVSEIRKAAAELGIQFAGITDFKCSGNWGVVDAVFGEEPNLFPETLVIRRTGDGWERVPTEEACSPGSALPADLKDMACS